MGVKILDCTLRDGGYVNNFDFGKKEIKHIISNLTKAGIDIIECGFLMDKEYNPNKTIFNDAKKVRSFCPKNHSDKQMYVAMIALGDIPHEKICERSSKTVDGIRITFHKPQIDEAFEFARKIKDKGYEVFIQPVGTTSYSDLELLNLINRVNEFNPFAFYIVDTLSIIYKKDIVHFFTLVDNNLNKGIKIGYHSHNNLQLAFSNAQEMVDLAKGRDIILDASIYGMGRGAGNLCSELIVDYLNNVGIGQYSILPILELLDNEISTNFSKTPWGYNTPYYLSSIHRCHPNYSTFLLSKQTISATAINNILNTIPREKRDLYDKNLISDLYLKYLSNEIDDSESYEILKDRIGDRSVLVLGAGSSIISHKSDIKNFIDKEKPLIVSVNFSDEKLDFNSNIVFFSNAKKFAAMDKRRIKSKLVIATSNIYKEIKLENMIPINFSSVLSSNQYVFDNAGLMFLKVLSLLNTKKVYLAGFDGFKNEPADYIKQHLFYTPERQEIIDSINQAMKQEINAFKKIMDIEFITPSQYE